MSGRAAVVRSSIRGASPKTTSPDPEVLKQQLREKILADAKIKRSSSIVQRRRGEQSLRSEAIELCFTSLVEMENMDVNTDRTSSAAHGSSDPLTPNIVRRINSTSSSTSTSEVREEISQEEGNELEKVNPEDGLVLHYGHGYGIGDEEVNEQDVLIKLFGREAFEDFMIELEEMLTAGYEEHESDEFYHEQSPPEDLEELDDAPGIGGAWEDWDEMSMIVCPLCKRRPMEVDSELLLGQCTGQCNGSPLNLAVLAVSGSESLKDVFEALLATEYDRCVCVCLFTCHNSVSNTVYMHRLNN